MELKALCDLSNPAPKVRDILCAVKWRVYLLSGVVANSGFLTSWLLSNGISKCVLVWK